ncbi:MAG: MAE_28990/MAE_18760 family HEPN-like nuclease [Enterobacterales bacterium]
MISVIRDFEERVLEINLYIDFVNKSQEVGASLHLPSRRKETEQLHTIDGDLTAILKANIFLILYNLIESSIREGVLSIYEEIQDNQCSYSDIRDDIKKLWTRYKFKSSFDMNASWESYYRRVEEITNAVVTESVISMDRNAIPTSGNLCANQVRSICDMHGIKTNVHRNARGGISLADIKDQRNSLAHGHLSFSECGRQFDITQIDVFKKETVIFVRGILKNMEEYVNNKEYLVQI